MVFGVHKQT